MFPVGGTSRPWIPGYPQTENRFTLMRVTTDDGVQGLAAGVGKRRRLAGPTLTAEAYDPDNRPRDPPLRCRETRGMQRWADGS